MCPCPSQRVVQGGSEDGAVSIHTKGELALRASTANPGVRPLRGVVARCANSLGTTPNCPGGLACSVCLCCCCLVVAVWVPLIPHLHQKARKAQYYTQKGVKHQSSHHIVQSTKRKHPHHHPIFPHLLSYLDLPGASSTGLRSVRFGGSKYCCMGSITIWQ